MPGDTSVRGTAGNKSTFGHDSKNCLGDACFFVAGRSAPGASPGGAGNLPPFCEALGETSGSFGVAQPSPAQLLLVNDAAMANVKPGGSNPGIDASPDRPCGDEGCDFFDPGSGPRCSRIGGGSCDSEVAAGELLRGEDAAVVDEAAKVARSSGTKASSIGDNGPAGHVPSEDAAAAAAIAAGDVPYNAGSKPLLPEAVEAAAIAACHSTLFWSILMLASAWYFHCSNSWMCC